MTARFLGSILNSPNSTGLYGADILDAEGIATVANAITVYQDNVNMFQDIHDDICSGTIIFCVSTAGRTADAFRRGLTWFPEMNPTWKWIIGAERGDLIETGCVCTDNNGQKTTIQGVNNCNNQYVGYPWVSCETQFEYRIRSHPSDGFILAESAMNAPGRNYKAQLMPGSNHMQMKNDSQMEEAVRKIFDDGIELGRGFFNTDPR